MEALINIAAIVLIAAVVYLGVEKLRGPRKSGSDAKPGPGGPGQDSPK